MKSKCEIRTNNLCADEPCAFCKQITKPGTPLAIFKRGTYTPVCDLCAEKYAPNEINALMVMRDRYEHQESEVYYAQERLRDRASINFKKMYVNIVRILPLFSLREYKQIEDELLILKEEVYENVENWSVLTYNTSDDDLPF